MTRRSTIPDALLREANRTHELRGRVKLDADRIALAFGGEIVGFFTPHADALGWRIGPLYVQPHARRHGLARAAWEGYRDRACVAFVPDSNPVIAALHAACGFTRWRPGSKGWYWRREPSE